MYFTGQRNVVDTCAAGTISEDLTEGSFASNSGWWSDDSDDDDRAHHSNVVPGTTKLASENSGSLLDKMYCMLESCPIAVAAWTRHGTAFAVYNREVFETTVLPQYLECGKFETFIRQLNALGFRKAKHAMNGTSVWEFRHPNFTKGHHLHTSARRRRRGRRGGNPEPSPRAGLKPVDGQLKSALVDMMSVVRNLKSELADTKALVVAYARMHHGNMD